MAFANETLTKEKCEALITASTILVDECFAAIDEIRAKEPELLDGTMIGMYLPRAFARRYNEHFLRDFLVAITVVGWKLVDTKWCSLSSRGEELALNAIIEYASTMLEEAGLDNDFDDFIEETFADTDVLTWFHASLDGLHDIPFDTWFHPSDSGIGEPVHPYHSGAGLPKGVDHDAPPD